MEYQLPIQLELPLHLEDQPPKYDEEDDTKTQNNDVSYYCSYHQDSTVSYYL